jgi:metallo-beta-lactamase family protein
MKISFYGGVGEVTGSRHLLEAGGQRLLLDCGLFQGHRAEALAKNKNVPFDPKSLDHVLLSHAHMDHSGALPLLTKGGYRKTIHSTEATADLCRLMLLDSAHLQEHDALFFNKIHAKDGKTIEPLYTETDVNKTMALFQGHPYHERYPLADRVWSKFYNASHVLGSALVEVEAEGKKLLFTGDLGRRRTILMDPPEIPQGINYLMIESTYANRVHDPISLVEGQMKQVIERAVAEKGKILIPSFALERTQEIVFVIEKLLRHKEIPPVSLWVDSPMATSITEVFSRHLDGFSFSPEFLAYVAKEGNPFQFQTVHYTRTVEESMKLNDMEGPLIILSASGMCEGGRILHHLRNNLDKPATTVLLVGYQAEGTLGRKLQRGDPEVSVYGFPVKVKARVETMHTFSAHADKPDLLWFIQSLGPSLTKIFLVHGDPDQRAAFQKTLKEAGYTSVETPQFGQTFELK